MPIGWQSLYLPELGRLQFSIDRQPKVPIFTFFGEGKGAKFQISSFLPPKRTTLARTAHNDVLSVGMCPKVRLVAMAKRPKKDKLSCVKLAIYPDHPRRHSPLKFCMRVGVCELYFKFHENRLRGLRAVEIENCPLPLTWSMAYTTACSTVQDMIVISSFRCSLLLCSDVNLLHCAALMFFNVLTNN